MVNTEHDEILEKILALLDTACQASLELLAQYEAGNSRTAAQLLGDLLAVACAVKAAQQPLLPRLEYAYTAEMLENVEDTLEDVRRSIEAGNSERAAMKMTFQLFPFLRQLREAFYFWGAVCPDKARTEAYYREEFAGHYQNICMGEAEAERPRLSIVVAGYNHLDTTRRCVEQLRKETDFQKLNAELLLIDHGSTDGTLEYFESLGIGRVIRFKRNVRMYMFAALPQLCRGKYFAFVSNDILVTKNWAEILLNCLESDERIIAAVPATPNIANLQALNLPDMEAEDFVAWADRQNRPDPSKWDDRARLMPPLGMYRADAVNQIGFADPYFYTMEYWDDDFSFRARRAGYRQIVCNDVACYHFGSVTGGEAQRKENTLACGRELFIKKNGVDAWGNGFCYDYAIVQLFKQMPFPQENISMLGIDCGMGDTPLQIRNELRRQHLDCEICQLTCQGEYFPDIQAHSREAAFTRDLCAELPLVFENKTFALTYIGRELEEYENWETLLELAASRTAPGGRLMFSCTNPFYAVTLHDLLRFSVPENRCVLLSPERVHQTVTQLFSGVQIISINQPVDGLEVFTGAHYAQSDDLSQIVKRLSVQKYYFVCEK